MITVNSGGIFAHILTFFTRADLHRLQRNIIRPINTVIAMYRLIPSITWLLFLLTGCTGLQPVELPPHELQQQIRAGELVAIGDRVLIATDDGQRHRFRITAMDDNTISGRNERLQITTIIALESREYSGGRTAALVGSSILVYQIMAAMAASIMIGF